MGWNTGQQRLLGADQALQLSVDLRNRTIVLGFLQVALLKRLEIRTVNHPSARRGVPEDRRTYSRRNCPQCTADSQRHRRGHA